MSNSKASNRKNTADILREQKQDRKKFFAARRQIKSGVSNVQFGAPVVNKGEGFSIKGPSLDLDIGVNIGNPVGGGSFAEAIAFSSKEVTIASDKITIATYVENPTSFIIVNGEDGNADDLKTIISKNIDQGGANTGDYGAMSRGQLLLLQAKNANITLKHNASGGNVWIPSGVDLTLNKYDSSANTGGAYAILMWDDQVVSTSGKWVLVSSGSSGSSSLLSSTNTWTGINTFQANVSFTGATTTIGDANTDLCTIYAKMGTDVNMGTYDINTLDRLLFDVNGSDAIGSSDYGIGAEAAGGSTVGLIYSTPASKTHKFNIGGTPELTISNSYISAASKRITNVSTPTGNNDAATKAYVDTNGGSSWNGNATSDLDMNTYDINTIDRLLFNTGGSDSIGSSDYGIGAEASGGSVVGMIFSVPSNKTHKFSIGGTPELTISNSYISAATKRITNVTDPSGAQDAATKAYVDANSVVEVVY